MLLRLNGTIMIELTKLLLSMIIIITLSKSASAMDEKQLPSEIHIFILKKLEINDLNHMFRVSSHWAKIADNEQIWFDLAFEKFADYAEVSKKEYLTWKAFLQDQYHIKSTAKNILNMADWQDISMIEEIRYPGNELAMIKNLEFKIFSLLKTINVSSPKKLLSFLISYYIVNISASADSAMLAAKNIEASLAQSSNLNNAKQAILCAINSLNLNTKSYLVGHINNRKYRIKKMENINYAYKKAAELNDLVINATRSALSKVNFSDNIRIAQIKWRLTHLYVLAYIAKDEFINEQFINNYQTSLDDIYDNTPKEHILEIMANNTWLKSEELASNQYIISLRKILETISKQIY